MWADLKQLMTAKGEGCHQVDALWTWTFRKRSFRFMKDKSLGDMAGVDARRDEQINLAGGKWQPADGHQLPPAT